MRKGIRLVGTRDHLAKYVGPRPRRFLFTSCGHVAGAHGTSTDLRLATIARAITLLSRSQYSMRFRKIQDRIKLFSDLILFEPKVGIHRWRLHNFTGIENIIGIPYLFEF